MIAGLQYELEDGAGKGNGAGRQIREKQGGKELHGPPHGIPVLIEIINLVEYCQRNCHGKQGKHQTRIRMPVPEPVERLRGSGEQWKYEQYADNH